MPVIQADHLRSLVIRMFEAAGVNSAIAQRTADHLVNANLSGVDSHGVMRLSDYIEHVLQGRMAREDVTEVVHDQGAMALWDAHYTFGQVVAWNASDKAIEKAKAFGIGIVSVRNCAHIGRLGEFTEHIARQGFIGYMCANLQGAIPSQRVAPHGGRKPRLGTNPISWGVPTGGEPMVFDASTGVSAEGKIRVKLRRGEKLPPNWLLDDKGDPTTDPAALYTDPPGSILPTGGHKGYALSLMAEAVAGALSGAGVSRPAGPAHSLANACTVMAINTEMFLPMAQFTGSVDELIAFMRSTPPIEQGGEVLIPNDPELRERKKRLEQGIPIEEESWKKIMAAAERLGVKL